MKKHKIPFICPFTAKRVDVDGIIEYGDFVEAVESMHFKASALRRVLANGHGSISDFVAMRGELSEVFYYLFAFFDSERGRAQEKVVEFRQQFGFFGPVSHNGVVLFLIHVNVLMETMDSLILDFPREGEGYSGMLTTLAWL